MWFCTRGIGGSVSLSALDPEVYSWMGRVRTNGGNYTSLSVVANDTFLKMSKSAGARPMLSRVNTYTGLDLLACLTPLINTVGSTAETNTGFVSGDYSESTGLNGGGTKNIDTGAAPTAFMPSANDGHLAVYNRTNLIDTKVVIGSFNGGTQCDWMVVGNTGNLTSCSVHDAGGGALNYTGDTDPRGFYMIARVASNDCQLYKNGASVVSYAGALVGTRATPNIMVHCYNDVGLGSQLKTTKILAGYSLGSGVGFTAAVCAGYYAAWQRLQTILGRQV